MLQSCALEVYQVEKYLSDKPLILFENVHFALQVLIKFLTDKMLCFFPQG